MIETKITRPQLPEVDIVRSPLLQRLDGLTGLPLTLISAPAGYGKTTTINQWLESRRVTHGWLSLDTRDNDPFVFWQAVCDAFTRQLARVSDAIMPLFLGLDAFNAESFPDALLRALNEYARSWSCPEHFVLVLDDFHCIDDRIILAGIRRLVDYAPGFFHLVLTSRTQPDLALSTLQVKNRLLLVSVAQLRFNAEEAAQLWHQRTGSVLGAETLAMFYQKTEGWPAAIQLAAWCLDNASVATVQEWSATRDPFLGDYLSNEIFRAQGESVCNFLLTVAPYGYLSATFCEQVLEQRHAGAMLELLVRKNLLITRFQQQGQRLYRLHELFRDWLEANSECRVPDESQIIRAAHWYLDNGLMMEGLQLLQQKALWQPLVDCLPAIMLPVLRQGGFAKVLPLLHRLPEAYLNSSPWALYGQAFVLFSQGQSMACDVCLVRAQSLLEADLERRSGEAPEQSMKLRLLHLACLLFRVDLARLRGDVQASQALMPHLNLLDMSQAPYLQAWGWQEQGAAYFMAGDFRSAQQPLVQAMALANTLQDRVCQAAVLSWLIPCLLGQGNISMASSYLTETREQWQDDIPYLPLTSVLPYLESQILREQGQLEAACDKLREAFAQAGTLLNPFHRVYFNFLRWRIAIGQKEFPEAERAATTLEKISLQYEGAWPFAVPEPRLLLAINEVLKGQPPLQMIQWAKSFNPTHRQGACVRHLAETLIWLRANLIAGQSCSEVLAHLQSEARALGLMALVCQCLLMEALGCLLQGNKVAGFVCLEDAFRHVDPSQMPQLYIDEMPHIEPLLRAALHQPELMMRAQHLLTLALSGTSLTGQVATVSPTPDALSQREREILVWLATGQKNADIARDLGISLATVKTHLQNIYNKLGASNRKDALVSARALGIL